MSKISDNNLYKRIFWIKFFVKILVPFWIKLTLFKSHLNFISVCFSASDGISPPWAIVKKHKNTFILFLLLKSTLIEFFPFFDMVKKRGPMVWWRLHRLHHWNVLYDGAMEHCVLDPHHFSSIVVTKWPILTIFTRWVYLTVS